MMMACQWCGDTHGVDRLCERAQRGVTRRSFMFLFGAGIAAAVLPNVAHPDRWEEVAELGPIDADRFAQDFIEYLRPRRVFLRWDNHFTSSFGFSIEQDGTAYVERDGNRQEISADDAESLGRAVFGDQMFELAVFPAVTEKA